MSVTEYALITGASKGLGKAFAFELSKRKINTILVGLPNEGLKEFSLELQANFGVKSVFYETDLIIKENILQLAKWTNENFAVSILINNAGMGGSNEFVSTSIDKIDDMIHLNVTAPAILTHQLLPNLLKQPKAYILNVASIAAYSPIGYKTVYPASKVFIYNFSRGLNQELSGTNVSVSVVNPGPMHTNSDVTLRINNQGFLGRLALISPETVACLSIKQLFKRKSVIILNASNRFVWLLIKIVPMKIRLRLMTNAIKKEIESKTDLLPHPAANSNGMKFQKNKQNSLKV